MTTTADTQSYATVDITVILCTYNRCEDLARSLQSIASSQVASSIAWEILVVDNNSTDQTRSIVEDFCHRYPGRFRYLLESKPGKSYALNTGIANAHGQVLAFVDDDVNVEPTWLQNLTAELLKGSEWAGAGGRTLPAEKFAQPPWLSNELDNWAGIVFAYFDLGDNASELSRAPYGTNMAFRKSVFEKHNGFRVDLGPRPNSQIRNEDTELGRRLLAAGERLRYEPSAIVYHPVPRARLTQEYFFSWWFDYGRALIRERGDRPHVYGVPWDYLSLLYHLAELPLLTLRWIFASNRQKRFQYRCSVSNGAGQVIELYRRSVGHKTIKTVGV